MKRGIVLRLAVLAALLLPGMAMAAEFRGGGETVGVAASQGGLPPLPMTAYGSAVGASAGQPVIAVVTDGSTQTVCGATVVGVDKGKAVYAIDVLAEGQRAGCGAPGRVVEVYFGPAAPGEAGWVAKESPSWEASLRQMNLTRGTVLDKRATVPMLAR